MSKQRYIPTADDGRAALRDHAADKARAARERHGPVIDDQVIMRVLGDSETVRYPTTIRFDESGLLPGEFAHAQAMGEHPREGYCLFIHPLFAHLPDSLPLIIAYYIAAINYGDIVESEDCEIFGAELLGMAPDAYYQVLCQIADMVPERDEV
jgi:hypothetical protein